MLLHFRFYNHYIIIHHPQLNIFPSTTMFLRFVSIKYAHINVTHFPIIYLNVRFCIQRASFCTCVLISFSQDIYPEGNLEKYRDTVPVSGLVFMSDVMKVYKLLFTFAISGFRPFINEIFTLLRYYAAYVGGWSRTFRDNLWVPYLRVKQSKKNVSYSYVGKCVPICTE